MKETFKNIRLKNLWILSLFPIYFGLEGLYKTNDIYKSGFIMPISFFFGVLICILIFYKTCYSGSLKFPRFIYRVPIYYLFAFTLALIGVVFSSNTVPIIVYMQFLSGTIGVILAVWICFYKRIDFVFVTGYVSKLFLILIVLNIYRALTTTGFAHFTNRLEELPGTPWWTIYHAFVYYPYIVAAVFLYAIPYWRNKINSPMFFFLYSIVFMYIWLFQVRGAVLSYGIGIAIYMLLYLKWDRLFATLFSGFLMVLTLFLFLPSDILKGRFDSGTKLISSFGGRGYLYDNFFNNFLYDSFYFIIGGLFRGRQVGGYNEISTNFAKGSIGGSYHNQYLELVEYGGVFLLIGFFWCIFPFVKLLINYVKNKNNKYRKDVMFFLLLMIMQLGIDMNINVPLRVTNPAIMYWFYWTGIGIYVSFLLYKNKDNIEKAN